MLESSFGNVERDKYTCINISGFYVLNPIFNNVLTHSTLTELESRLNHPAASQYRLANENDKQPSERGEYPTLPPLTSV